MNPIITTFLKLKLTDLYALRFLKNNKEEMYEMLCAMNKTEALFGGAYKYFHLSEILDQYKPNHILELGSGFSTGVFALYCKNNKAKACTFEHSEKWCRNTLENLGDLSNYINVKNVNYIEEKESPPKTYYNEYPDAGIDFVYVDGPPLTENAKINGNVVNWDVIRMIEQGNIPRVIVVDIRLSTARYLFEKYNHLYEYYPRESKKRFLKYRYHSIFIKKNAPVS